MISHELNREYRTDKSAERWHFRKALSEGPRRHRSYMPSHVHNVITRETAAAISIPIPDHRRWRLSCTSIKGLVLLSIGNRLHKWAILRRWRKREAVDRVSITRVAKEMERGWQSDS